MTFDRITIVSFPQSQYCMECRHGEPIQSKTYNNNNYICRLGKREIDKNCINNG